jgi:hypothetical protein
MNLENIFYIIIGLYSIIHLLLFIGLVRNKRKPRDSGYVPIVSVVISAKDEEGSIEDCINSPCTIIQKKS